MGKEAEVEARWPDGRIELGRLLYEPPKLIFRGPERRVFTGERLAGVRAEGRELVLHGGERFHLPGPAASWAEAILNPKGRLDKLGVKAGQRIGVIGVEDAAFVAELSGRAPPTDAGEGLDLMFYGADSAEALAGIGRLVGQLAPNGAIWVVSLKGRAAQVKDTEVMAAAKLHGLVDTKVCGFSDTHTALRFVRRRS
jgi:hypothetical protein